MARSQRRTPGREFMMFLAREVASLNARQNFSHFGSPAIANGTTNGRLQTVASVTGRIAGVEVTKAATDNLWNLSAETTLAAAQYKAYWLYINAAGTASIAGGTVKSSLAGALAALPAIDEAKCVIGVFVAGPSTNFANALSAQGTVYNGIPAGASLDGTDQTLYLAPARLAFTKA